MVINFNFEIMKIKNIKILLFAFLFLPLMLVSCDEDDKNDGIDFLENDGTKAEQFAGDWYIVFQLEGITLTNPAPNPKAAFAAITPAPFLQPAITFRCPYVPL